MANITAPIRRPRLFGLVPINEAAKGVVRNPKNKKFVAIDPIDGTAYLDVCQTWANPSDSFTLATLGRNGSIVMEGSNVSRIQCEFVLYRDAQVIMLEDRSRAGTTQVYAMDPGGIVPLATPPKVFPFRSEPPRRVYVGPTANPVVGMCGPGRNQFLFRLVWNARADTKLADEARVYAAADHALAPSLARTQDDTETAVETRQISRMLTPGAGAVMRYVKLARLGAGSFGEVYRVIDVDTGRKMALKTIQRPRDITSSEWQRYQREVRILDNVDHPHIVDLIWTQHWDRPKAEIFLGLKDGSLEKLVSTAPYMATNANGPQNLFKMANTVLLHMLQALDYLATRSIVHRDVKPANILYVVRPNNELHFVLGDFGVSNQASLAVSVKTGTGIYMAPEVWEGNNGDGRQTHKADVWSLFATMLWTLDFGRFRSRCLAYRSYNDARSTVLELASNNNNSHNNAASIASIAAMAVVDPAARASAAQMLCSVYDGKGLSTPKRKVPPLQRPLAQPLPSVSPFALALPATPNPAEFLLLKSDATMYREQMQRQGR
ncbi:hypothetical protein SEUCBS139899_004253 [Sporothrix eucalyptigena]